jgi:hypothetical protein
LPRPAAPTFVRSAMRIPPAGPGARSRRGSAGGKVGWRVTGAHPRRNVATGADSLGAGGDLARDSDHRSDSHGSRGAPRAGGNPRDVYRERPRVAAVAAHPGWQHPPQRALHGTAHPERWPHPAARRRWRRSGARSRDVSVGALARARAGFSYEDILSAYFPGTELSRY